MRVYKTKWFRRFARRESIADTALCDAVARAVRGNVDADLGSGVLKQRVARPGQGRSGGYRTLIVYRVKDRAIFVFGFAKSERDNIDDRELNDLKKLARHYLGYSDSQIATVLEQRELREVVYDVQKEG